MLKEWLKNMEVEYFIRIILKLFGSMMIMFEIMVFWFSKECLMFCLYKNCLMRIVLLYENIEKNN